ncbi:MAG: glycosyltransferase [Myxococcota bacterium]|nr:glycosyltransferase [Myxococcota bacterium]MDP7298711.1 glycosyltransferase [Myxococcota bacterium]MDP7433425.1 glycosyltransferase [Myxococcota bacterium]
MDASIVIRTYNEAKRLPELLGAIAELKLGSMSAEVILVDSGSTDETVTIGQRFGCRIVHILKQEFTFGRSLNLGCEAANANLLVFISGHCVPVSGDWLVNLVAPIDAGEAAYTYGRQIGNNVTKFSEHQIFRKFYPPTSLVPTSGFFCNNANAAISKEMWAAYGFDEGLTGLEDMDLAKRLVRDGYRVAYVAEAPIYHIHEESWGGLKLRYEREAIALQRIMPEVHISAWDFLAFFCSAVFMDWKTAFREGCLVSEAFGIVLFRFCQFWGTYSGNHDHRKLSQAMKKDYFYPR